MTDNASGNRGNFWLYVGLGISGLLNLTGMASIVDGLVIWAEFFRDFIDTYRWAIRDPLAYIGNAIWPFGMIPSWVFDVFVIYSALFLALNLVLYQKKTKLFFGEVRDVFREKGLIAAVAVLLLGTVFFPIIMLSVILGFYAGNDEVKKETKETVQAVFANFLYILGLFILILLINWQIKKLGG